MAIKVNERSELHRFGLDEKVGGTPAEQLHLRIVKRFRGGLAFMAYRRLYHSTLGSRVKKEEEKYLSEGRY